MKNTKLILGVFLLIVLVSVFAITAGFYVHDKNEENISLTNEVLSPDGKKIAFSDNEGLKIKDTSSGLIQTIRKNVIPKDPDVAGAQLFSPYSWSLDGKYLLYSIRFYEGSHQGILDVDSGIYNEKDVVLSPDNIFFIQRSGKNYLVYYVSSLNDYGGIQGLYVVDISSVENIKTTSLVQDKEIDIVSSSYDTSKDLINFDFYRYDYKKETKTKYKGTVSLDGGAFSEEIILTEKIY